jgi:histidyl-tRNA synthetase
LPKQFKFADQMKMKVAVTIGPEEADKGQVAIKDLFSGNQQIVQRGEAAGVIRKILESNSGR